MKKRTKLILAALAALVVLTLATPLLIYVPPVQQWLVQKVAAIASEQTGMDITVGSVSLKFPLDLEVEQVGVRGDLDARIERAVVNVKVLPLLRKQVVVERLDIEQAEVNTLGLISDTQVAGTLGRLSLSPSNIHWGTGDVNLSELLLADADMSVVLSDTAAVDTTDTGPVLWRIAIDGLTILNSKVSVTMPGDSMRIAVGIGQGQVSDGLVDLAEEHYTVGSLNLDGATLNYDLPYEPLQPDRLDYSHLHLSDIGLHVDSLLYHSPITQMNIRHLSAKEQCGLTIEELNGLLTLDATGIRIPQAVLRTPYSYIRARADIDYSMADSISTGQMNVDLEAQLHPSDLLPIIPSLATSRTSSLTRPLSIKGAIDGNMQESVFRLDYLDVPTALYAEASGTLGNLNNIDQLLANVDLKVQTQNMKPWMTAFGLSTSGFNLPPSMSVAGNVTANGPGYTARLTARESQAVVQLKGSYNLKTDAYEADLAVSNLNLQHFLPSAPCTIYSGQTQLKGRGFDPEAKNTRLEASADIGRVVYGDYDLDSLVLTASLHDGHAVADLISQNSMADGHVCLDALLSGKPWKATVETNIAQLDLFAMKVVDAPLAIGLNGSFDITTDLSQNHRLSGFVQNIYLRDSLQTIRPENLGVLITARPDTTYLRIQNGNFIAKVDASGDIDRLTQSLTALADTLKAQLDERVIDQATIKQMLPTMRLYVTSGRENAVAGFLNKSAGIGFRDLLVDVTTSADRGVNGQAHVFAFSIDSTRIDTLKLTLKDSDHGLTYQAQATNNRRNREFVFNALLDGHIYEKGARAGLRFFDSNGRLGLRIGTAAAMEADGLRFTLLPARPTIGYKEYALNDDNYLYLGRDLKLSAKVALTADDGTGIKVYSEDQDSTQLQDLTVSLHKVDLDHVTATLPFLPKITGQLNGDYHLMMDQKKQISVVTDMQVRQLTYEGSPMGNLETGFVYLQREDETHAVDGFLSQDGREIATFSGSYTNKKVTAGHEYMDGTLSLQHTPLGLINGFIPDQLLGLEGFAEGDLTIKGALGKPVVDGELMLDSAFLVSQPYGVRLRFDNDPVRIQQSKLLLENFTMYAYNDNPLNIMGSIDFGNLERMSMDVRMRARDFLLINARQTAKSLAYGKGYVNFLARMNGPMDKLNMRGKLDVLGTTDLTYLMLDSPLSTDNQLDELVKFTDFSDTTRIVITKPTPDGLNMDLTISIDQGAHVKCGLNADQTNYVDLYGGGDLRMRYNGGDGLQLTGRYTLTSGEMKYSLPIIPLKTFTIQNGSYVEFTGDVMNPTLNITATERNKASVGQEGGQSRSVAFDCGVVITKTLSNMGLQFIISAPEDMTISSELNSMSAEQRGKLAVTMLTTGMYLADGNTSGFSMNSALNSFLQSEINSITAGALQTVDLSIGLENSIDASGQSHTDYSFRFAKRFWNNRLKVQIGGTVSSGQDAVQGQNKSFFDNVTMEYRLSPTGNQYVKLFYNQNAYDWLEGYTTEYGGGYIWKRKMDHWWEMFRLKASSTEPSPNDRRMNPNHERGQQRPDSTKVQ